MSKWSNGQKSDSKKQDRFDWAECLTGTLGEPEPRTSGQGREYKVAQLEFDDGRKTTLMLDRATVIVLEHFGKEPGHKVKVIRVPVWANGRTTGEWRIVK